MLDTVEKLVKAGDKNIMKNQAAVAEIARIAKNHGSVGLQRAVRLGDKNILKNFTKEILDCVEKAKAKPAPKPMASKPVTVVSVPKEDDEDVVDLD